MQIATTSCAIRPIKRGSALDLFLNSYVTIAARISSINSSEKSAVSIFVLARKSDVALKYSAWQRWLDMIWFPVTVPEI